MIAYSYGVTEALELVGILEAKGYVGTVYCIDGAPVVMNNFLENVFGTSKKDIEKNSLLNLLMMYDIPLTELQNMSVSTRATLLLYIHINFATKIFEKNKCN